MSKRMGVEFVCMVCEATNPTQIIKPKPFQSTVTKRECEVCDSEILLKFGLIKGNKKQVSVEYLRFFITEKGQNILKGRTAPTVIEQVEAIATSTDNIQPITEQGTNHE